MDKGKEPIRLNRAGYRPSGPKISASHSNLTDGLQKVGEVGPDENLKKGYTAVGLKNTKETIVTDITNNSSMRPMTMKASRSGSNNGLNSQTKDKEAKGIKHINQAWADEDVIELMDTQGSSDGSEPHAQSQATGFGGGRPPDPVRSR